MKTTIELPDELLDRTRKAASHEGATLKAFVEEGLHMVLQARERRPPAYLRVKPFKGDGLTAEFRDAGWERLRDEIYHGRG